MSTVISPRRLALLAALCSALSVISYAQTAQVTGRINDAAQAIVPGAAVTVTNLDTGIERTTTTNDEGYFTVPLLPRGNYKVGVSKPGFKPVARTGVNLDEGQVLRLDLQLETGEVQDAVEITGAAPLLEAATPTMSTVIPNEKITQLPLLNRNIITLAALAPTVRPVGAFGGLPVSSFDGARMSIGGGPPSSNNLMIDGVSAENFTSGGLNVFLSVDATEEFRIVTRNPSAEYGRTGGGVVNIVSKSGTNEWHGSAYEFHRNRALNAANFFFNRNRRPDALGNLPKKPQFTLNQWGATLGGPVVKNKTFFFFNYEGFELRETQQAIRTVPTALQRQGDFRGTLDAQGRQVMIYDPATTRPNPAGAGFIRDVISCNGVQNVICPNRIHPVAKALLDFYPQPNQPGVAGTGANNFFGLVGVPQNKRIYGIKLDHNFTASRRLSGRYTYDDTFRGDPNFFANDAEPNESALPFRRDSVALNYTDALSSTIVMEMKAGLNRYAPNRITRSLGFDLTKLGFNSAVNNLVQLRQFPRFNISDVNVIGASQGDQLIQANNAYTFGAAATQTLGKQTLKYGVEQRIYQLNNSQLAVPVLDFSFSRAFTQGPTPNATGANVGYGLATFLLGHPTAGAVSRFASSTYTVKNTGLYLQDDYKITPKLTLNLGLRWEYEGPLTDRYDAIANFDPTLATQVGNVPVRGGLIYPNKDSLSRGHREASYKDFQPRLGFAYQLFEKTVVRGGYGIYYLPSTGNFVTLGRTGFDQTTPLIATDAGVNGGFSPVANLTNPFPGGALAPTGNTGGPTTGVGTGVSANLRTMGRGYSQQANFNVQHELPGQFLVEVGYAMNRGVGLPANRTYDYLPFAVRQRFTRAELEQQVPNPFFGIIRTGGLSNATVQRQTLLDTYPQYLGAAGLDSWASSIYHAMTVKVERRFTRGFSVLASYTWSKLIDDNLGNGANGFTDGGNEGVQDWDNLRAERSISSNDLPHRFVLTALYDLPFGKEGHPVYRAIVGGWQLNGILTLQSGNPIGVTVGAGGRFLAGSRPNLVGDPDPGSSRSIDNWLVKTPGAAFDYPAERTPGNGPRNLSNYRTDGLSTLDLAMHKNFSITERFRLQFRAEAFNFTNTPTFGQPGTGFGNANFGVITSTVTQARQVQLGLKLLF
jgi:outer membrane receptor protein involved in Fe transport